ncbi:AbrB/MazE/SpoVT family DNA-binding domain-containing protein, partial [Pseudomonas aeruginosa]|nr:AbrB/MazE/SpoVT family DNA-binding domain-containing protein [Pseudomonas aeruginosa]
MKRYVVIEDWEGDGAIRLPDDALQEMGVDVGDTLYLL